MVHIPTYLWAVALAAAWTLTADVAMATKHSEFPKPPQAEVRDLDCLLPRETQLKVIGAAAGVAESGETYLAVLHDRNSDGVMDVVLFYPYVTGVQVRPFPTVYAIDRDLDGKMDEMWVDMTGDGVCKGMVKK